MITSLTKGKPLRLIIAFALPMMFGNICQLLYSMVDMIIVGRTLGVDALAGVGLTGPIGFMFIGLVIGLSQGFSIYCAQLFGADNKTGLRRAFCASLILAFIISILLMGASLLSAAALRLTNAPEDAFAPALDYLSVTLLGSASLVFYNIFSSSITALGDSRTPLVFLILTCILNIAFDFLFIIGFSMGTAGAAWATNLSLGISAVCCAIHIRRRIPELWPHMNDWRRLPWSIFKKHLALGLPMGLQGALINIGFLVLQTALNGLGPEAIAACTSVARVDAIAIMPLVSIGRAMSTYAGQNIGALLPERVHQGLKDGSKLAFGYAWIAATFCIVAGGELIRLFVGNNQEGVVAYGQRLLQIQCGFYWLLALMFVLRNTLQGLGKSVIATMSGIIELIIRCAVAIFLVEPLGFDGICIASPLAWLGGILVLIPPYMVWKKTIRKATIPRHDGKNV